MRKFLLGAKVLIGHNIKRWDIPVLERLLDIKITAKIIDTLALSWYLYPDRFQHGLEQWGIHYGVPKPFILDWENQTQEEYEHRCKEDVRINRLLWNDMFRYLFDIYGSDKELWKLLDYLELKMHCAYLQEKSQWKLDMVSLEKNLTELLEVQEDKLTALQSVMPEVPVVRVKEKPKRFLNNSGEYTKLGMEWIALLTERGLPPSHEDPLEIIKGYEPGNPNSTDQVKDWLFSLGWVPQKFKDVKHKITGETKSIPQINLDQGKGICPSIKLLYPKEPHLELLEGLSVLQHRIGILKGFMRDQEDGWIKARINGLTNTLRFQHTTVVNLPKPDKLYAEPVRSALIAPEGYELCGSDMSSLEDRIKQHFIWPYDPDYVREMMSADYDPHLSLALLAEKVTIAQVEAYNNKTDQSIKPIRDVFKNGNYACQYGAGPPRLAITAGISVEEARFVWQTYWKKNWAIKKVASEQTVKTVNDQMWLRNPISGLWYSLRYEKDIFSTLVQGTASYVFDLWVQIILGKREQLTGQFHDEFIICVRQGHRDACEALIRNAMKELNETLNLDRELGCDVQFGDRYSLIH